MLSVMPVAAQRYTTVPITPAANAAHQTAFTGDIGFGEWFDSPDLAVRGVPFRIEMGERDIVRLGPGQTCEVPLPGERAAALHLLATGGYLATPGELRADITFANGAREEHTREIVDWNYGARYPGDAARTFEPTAFGGAGKTLYAYRVPVRRKSLPLQSLRLTAGDRGTFIIAALTIEPVLTQEERLAPLPESDLGILVEGDDGPITRFAAEQLQLYVSLMEGKRPPIGQADRRTVHLRRDADVSARLGEDGFRLAGEGESLTITGGGATGVLYGSYALLESQGVRFFMPGEEHEVVPKREVSLAVAVVEERPDWARRGITYYPYEFDEPADWVDFAAKTRLNTILFHAPAPDWWEREREMLNPELERRGIHIDFGGHFMPGLLPRSLFAEHPDWFRMENGERRADYNLCPSSPEALAMIAQGAAEIVRRNPEPEVFSIWPDDLGGGGWCHCEKCAELSASDQSLTAMNAMARAMREVRPDARVVFLAYQDTVQPPTRVQPEPGVVLLWAPRERCYVHGLNDPSCPRNVAHARALEGLLRVFDPAETEVFEYYLDQILYQDIVPTLPQTLQADLAYYRSLGIKVVEPLMVSLVPFRSVLANAGLSAGLQWDEDADPQAWLRDLAGSYFGDEDVSQYFVQRETALRPILSRCYDGIEVPDDVASTRRADTERSFVQEFPLAWGILERALLRVPGADQRQRLLAERAGLFQAVDHARALARP